MAFNIKTIKLLLVDMDNTLCNTHAALSKAQWEAVARAFERKGKPEYAQALRRNLGKIGFAATLKAIKATPAERKYAVQVYDRVDIDPLQLYPDVPALWSVKTKKILVSRGEARLQRRKIRHLGLQDRFDRIIIVPTFESKSDAFRRVLADSGLRPSEVLVIGDRPEDEIADGRRLRMPTCLIKRPGWNPTPGKADITVRSLATLAKQLA